MVRLGLGQPGQKLAFHRSIERAINLVKKVERLELTWLTRRRSINLVKSLEHPQLSYG